MKKSIVLMAVLFAISAPPATVAAMEHGKMEGMEHGKMEGMEHGKMEGMEHGKMEGMEHGKMEGMEHGKMEGMEHGKMEGMEHGGMMMEGGMMMLGEESEEGVKGMAHLKDVQAAMSKMGMKETHHFMIMLMDEKTGEAIETGEVALKIKTPSGNEGKPIKLMGMQEHFGADVTLAEKGEYHFTVGTKVKDGKKRKYHFHYEVK